MIELVMLLLGVALFPFAGLAFLLWMAWLEDSLPAAVRRSERTADPEPILAIPVSPPQAEVLAAEETTEVVLPAQRQASEVSFSTEPSLGGSTNR